MSTAVTKENKLSDYSLFVFKFFDLQCIVRRYKRCNVALLPSTFKADGSQYLKVFVRTACHVNPRLEQNLELI